MFYINNSDIPNDYVSVKTDNSRTAEVERYFDGMWDYTVWWTLERKGENEYVYSINAYKTAVENDTWWEIGECEKPYKTLEEARIAMESHMDEISPEKVPKLVQQSKKDLMDWFAELAKRFKNK